MELSYYTYFSKEDNSLSNEVYLTPLMTPRGANKVHIMFLFDVEPV